MVVARSHHLKLSASSCPEGLGIAGLMGIKAEERIRKDQKGGLKSEREPRDTELIGKQGLEMTSRAWLPAHSTLAQEGQQVGQSMPGWWAEISHQDPSFCICGSWELRFDLATANHFF